MDSLYLQSDAIKIQNNTYQLLPVENVDFGEEKQSS